MSRRSRSSSNSKRNLAAYLIIALAVAGALVVGYMFISKDTNPHPELSVSDIRKGGTQLSGNIYKVTGKILERNNLPDNKGLLLTVTSSDSKSESGPIPIVVPKDVEKINLERTHKYVFTVKVDLEGVPVALDIKAQ